MTLFQKCFCTAAAVMLVAPLSRAADEVIQTSAISTDPITQATNLAKGLNSSLRASDPPFVPLIVGDDLRGWQIQEGNSKAWSRDGDMISCTSATGGWLRTNAEYSDFVVKLEYRLQSGGNTGIGLRAPATGNPTFTGIEIQLLDDTSPKYADLRPDQYTGSVYYQVAAAHKARLNALQEWNQCEIRCLGDELTVRINGDIVNQIQLSPPRTAGQADFQPAKPHLLSQRPPLGHLALQSHSSRVDFRNIQIQDLTITTPSGLKYVDLAPGSGENVGNARQITMHYVGQLVTGKRFTDSREAGSPIQVPMEGLVAGLQEGLHGMKIHGRRRLVVPAHLAYGTQGVSNWIPPDSTLIIEVEVVGVTR